VVTIRAVFAPILWKPAASARRTGASRFNAFSWTHESCDRDKIEPGGAPHRDDRDGN